MKFTNQSYSATVRTFVPSEVTSPLFMRDTIIHERYYTNKILKSSYFVRNILKIDRKISDFLQKSERSIYKRSYIKVSYKNRFLGEVIKLALKNPDLI